jgi:hypothetical protein
LTKENSNEGSKGSYFDKLSTLVPRDQRVQRVQSVQRVQRCFNKLLNLFSTSSTAPMHSGNLVCRNAKEPL